MLLKHSGAVVIAPVIDLLGCLGKLHSDEVVRQRLGVDDVLEAVQIVVYPASSLTHMLMLFTQFHCHASSDTVTPYKLRKTKA